MDAGPDDVIHRERFDEAYRLTMVASETAMQYRVMELFNLRWTAQFLGPMDVREPRNCGRFRLQIGDAFTKEEMIFGYIIGKRDL